MSNIRVRGIILINDGIVLIHRIKNIDNVINEYYPLPGGGVEKNETLEECIIREIKEEIGFDIKPKKQLYKMIDDIAVQYIYLCDYISGEIGTGIGPEYTSEEYSTKGIYIPEIIKISDLEEINLVPIELKQQLIQDLKQHNLENIEYKEIQVLKTTVI